MSGDEAANAPRQAYNRGKSFIGLTMKQLPFSQSFNKSRE